MRDKLNIFFKLSFIGFVCGWVFLLATNYVKTKSYDECILKNMPLSNTREASLAIERSCRSQFPQKYISEEKFMGK